MGQVELKHIYLPDREELTELQQERALNHQWQRKMYIRLYRDLFQLYAFQTKPLPVETRLWDRVSHDLAMMHRTLGMPRPFITPPQLQEIKRNNVSPYHRFAIQNLLWQRQCEDEEG